MIVVLVVGLAMICACISAALLVGGVVVGFLLAAKHFWP
jgi:hypothetical protein